MQRILQSTSATVRERFTVDGTVTDPDDQAATVTIVRGDGTVLVNAASAVRASAGVFQYSLTPTQTGLLDRLQASWTATIGGSLQTLTSVYEIVGGFLFTLAELRGDDPAAQDYLPNNSTYPNEKLAAARTYAEQEIEQACGVAFVPRYTREILNVDTAGLVSPSWRTVRAVRSATVAGIALTVGELATVTLAGDRAYYGWSGPVTVGYEHGYDFPPAAVANAAVRVAKDKLVNTQWDDRAIQRGTEFGPVFVATPGWQGKRFGIPEVDAVVDAYRLPVFA